MKWAALAAGGSDVAADGHLHAAVLSTSDSTPQVEAGVRRVFATAVPRSRTGLLASIPTLAGPGMNAPAPDTRRSVFSARAFEPARVYRPDAAWRAYAADDHAGCLIRYDVASPLLEGRKRVGHFEAHYTHTRSVLVEPGMAK